MISQQSVSELQALFYLGGGVAGMQYVVTVTATLPNGKVMQAIVILQVLANPAPLNPACYAGRLQWISILLPDKSLQTGSGTRLPRPS